MTTLLADIRNKLNKLANRKDAAIQSRFFKTGKGEYGEGDIFIGVRVPKIRALAKQYRDAPLSVPKKLLKSSIHEERLLALIMLIDRFNNGAEKQQKDIYEFYLASTRYINNWDLVDVSADKIVGAWLYARSRRPLLKLVKSGDLWERRIAIMATFYFIRLDDYEDTLRFARILLKDEHDLIHKATGWMLREIGKRDRAKEEQFLKKHYQHMPRTMLRYAIEKLPETLRKKYLAGEIRNINSKKY